MNSNHGYIRTASGRRIDPTNPQLDDIEIHDIATSLARQVRWGGHQRFSFDLNRHYSIAEHSCHVAAEVFGRTKDYSLALKALLHDGTEAYVVDVPRPIKRQLGAPYAELEQRFAMVIGARYGIALDPLPDVVRQVDDQILHDEALAFMDRRDPEWKLGENPIGVQLQFWSPRTAYHEFMGAFSTLYNYRSY